MCPPAPCRPSQGLTASPSSQILIKLLKFPSFLRFPSIPGSINSPGISSGTSCLWKLDCKGKLAGVFAEFLLLSIFSNVLPSKPCQNSRWRGEVVRKDFLTNFRNIEGFWAFFPLYWTSSDISMLFPNFSLEPILLLPLHRKRPRFVWKQVVLSGIYQILEELKIEIFLEFFFL